MKEQSEPGSTRKYSIYWESIHYWRKGRGSFTNSNKLNITEGNLSQIILTTGQVKNPITTFPLTSFCSELTYYGTELKAT